MANQEFRVMQAGAKVLILINGQLVMELTWDNALEVSRAIHSVAKLSEEFAKANEIITDQAILLRSGFPVDLTTDPAILKEAANEAAWNSNLRRYLPGGIKSKERFGKPAVYRHPLRGKQTND